MNIILFRYKHVYYVCNYKLYVLFIKNIIFVLFTAINIFTMHLFKSTHCYSLGIIMFIMFIIIYVSN